MKDLTLEDIAFLLGLLISIFVLIVLGMAIIVLFNRWRDRRPRRSGRTARSSHRRDDRIPEREPIPTVLNTSVPARPTFPKAPGFVAAPPSVDAAITSDVPRWQGWWEKVQHLLPRDRSQDAADAPPEADIPLSGSAVPTLTQTSTTEPSTTSAVDESQVVSFRQWWRELWEIVNHLFVLGGTGSGKTTTVRAMVRYIALVLKHQVVILDPKANIDTWCGLRAQTKADAIEAMLQALLADFENRLERNATLTEAEAQKAFPHVWIVVDELSFVRDNCPTWPLLIRRLSSMARALNMHLIIINQSATAEEIGLKGRADLLKNFSRLQLTKAVWRGKPASLNLDGEVMTIEWKPVTVLSQKSPELPPSARYVAPDISAEERPVAVVGAPKVADTGTAKIAAEATAKTPVANTPEVAVQAAVAEAPKEASSNTPVVPVTEEKTASPGGEQRIALSEEDRQVLSAAYAELSKGEAEVSARGLARRAFGATGGAPWRKAAQFLAEVINASVEGNLADRQSSPALAA